MSKLHKRFDFIQSYGRNRARALSPTAQALVDELLPELSLHELVKNEIAIDINTFFPGKNSIHLEIGFGAGEHLLNRARHNPDVGFIGCEPFINGVAQLLEGIAEHKVENIKIFTGDVRLLLPLLTDSSIDQTYILFPDPWPKVRHNKRRLLNHDTLAMLSRIQPQTGKLLLATDHVDYCAWMFEKILSSKDYNWTGEHMTDWKTPPDGWVKTKYQKKAEREGRAATFIDCVRC